MRTISKRNHRAALAICTAAIVGAAFASSAKAQNLLLDPGFEAGQAGAPDATAGDVGMGNPAFPAAGPWLGFNNWVYPYSGFYTQSVVAHSGTQVGKTFSGPNGGIYQFVTAYSGDTYSASAWFDFATSDPLNGPETDDVRLIFFGGPNGTGSNLGTFVTPFPVSDLNTPDTWIQLSVNATAPAGTQSVQWMAFFNNPDFSGGSLFVDDTSLIDTSPVWNGAGADNNWTSGNNWGGTAPVAPSSLVFDGSARTINTNNFPANTAFSTIRFNPTASPFVISGNAVNLNGDVVNNSPNNQTINLALAMQQNTNFNAAAGNLTIGGAISGGFTLTANGANTVTLSGANSYSGGTTVSAGTLVIGAAGALPANSAVSVAATGTMRLATGTGGETLSSLSIATGGTFDIGNNHLILSYSGTSPASTLYTYLQSGYNGGGTLAWTGTGINSSTAALAVNRANYGVGYVDGADGVPGASVTSGQILVAYALYGDINLDGLVNATDFAVFGANFNTAVKGWDKGDFTYTGLINATDFALLGANFGKSASGASLNLPQGDFAALDAFAAANGLSLPSVPEPASAALLALACFGTLGRRKRR